MTNTSATGGYLQPSPTTPPLQDDALTDFLQAVVAGISGLDGSLVRPAWQEEPPNLPDRNVTWGAMAVITQTPMFDPEVDHDGDGDGQDNTTQQEVIELLCSFYGPAAGAVAGLLSQGFWIAQNREQLQLAGFGLITSGEPRRAPEMIKEKWLARVDLTVTLRREIRRVYPVLNLLSAVGVIKTETFSTNFSA